MDKTKHEKMISGGKKLGEILNELVKYSKVGTNLLDIEKRAQELIVLAGGTPSFMTVADYKWATCLCVNEEVVHGIPRDYLLKDGDILTIDVGLLYQGYHTDTATSLIVSNNPSLNTDHQKFLETGREALNKAIKQAVAGNYVGDISKTIEEIITQSGYSIIKSLVGHGVGKTLHEEPQIPGFLQTPKQYTPKLTSGQTVAVEVIYAMGKGHILTEPDGWTMVTRDGSLSAVFEHSLEVGNEQAYVLTKV